MSKCSRVNCRGRHGLKAVDEYVVCRDCRREFILEEKHEALRSDMIGRLGNFLSHRKPEVLTTAAALFESDDDSSE